MINEQQATTEIPQNRKTKQKRVVADDAKARSKLLLMFLAVGKIYIYILYIVAVAYCDHLLSFSLSFLVFSGF